ncbi:MAG: arylsulfatase [Phycisphaerae bacterium]|nr:arylsulfatase [Phycisphaerae bacterium]
MRIAIDESPSRSIWGCLRTVSLCVGIVVCAACPAMAGEARGRPNIIFIMADDLGYGHLGCYGQKLIRTPSIDRLAEQGMRFTQCYAGAPVCAPSRSVLMTGLHGGHASVRGNTGGIPLLPEDVTVAEVLKQSGYTTGLFGKWGLGEHGTAGVPYKQGFDEFFGYLHQIHAHFYYPEYLWQNDRKYPLEGNDGKGGRYTHDEIVAKALEFIRGHKDGPFFLYVPFAVPHYELLVPEDSLREYRGKFPETPYRGRDKRRAGYPRDYAAQETPKAAIAAMITRMDRSVGRIMALLSELGIGDNTIVFFTSDNGPSYGPGDPEFFKAAGPLRGVKASLYEGGIRVPMIVRWPGKVGAGSASDHAWYFADVMPTLAELGGAKSPEGVDGVSVAATLLGRGVQGKREYMYWEFDGGRAVRAGQWKAVRGPRRGAKLELYDLSSDIGETRDVAADHPDVVAKMTGYMNGAHTPCRPQIEPKKPKGRQYQ